MWITEWKCSRMSLINLMAMICGIGFVVHASMPLPETMREQVCCSKDNWTTNAAVQPSNETQRGMICCPDWDYKEDCTDRIAVFVHYYFGLEIFRGVLAATLLFVAILPWHWYTKDELMGKSMPDSLFVKYGCVVVWAIAIFVLANIVLLQGASNMCKTPDQTRDSGANTLYHHTPFDFFLLVFIVGVPYLILAVAVLAGVGYVMRLYLKVWCDCKQKQEKSARRSTAAGETNHGSAYYRAAASQL